MTEELPCSSLTLNDEDEDENEDDDPLTCVKSPCMESQSAEGTKHDVKQAGRTISFDNKCHLVNEEDEEVYPCMSC